MALRVQVVCKVILVIQRCIAEDGPEINFILIFGKHSKMAHTRNKPAHSVRFITY